MKTNIVKIGNANMSGHTEVPDGSLLEGADSAGLTHAEREMTEMLLTMFERRMRGGASYAEGTIELGMGAVRGFLNFVKLPRGSGCRAMSTSSSATKSSMTT